ETQTGETQTGETQTGETQTGETQTGEAQATGAQASEAQANGAQAGSVPAGDSGGTAAGGTGAGGTGAGGSRRTKVLLLTAAGVGVLVIAGVTIGTLGAASPARHTTNVSDRHSGGAQAGPATPLQVESVTQGGAVTGTNGASPVRVTLSAPLASNSPMPDVDPATPGTWAKAGTTLTFTPSTPFWPGTRVRVTLAGGQRGLRSAAGGLLAKTTTERFSTAHWSSLRLKQMLAQLGYLPLKWKPQSATAFQPDNMATELATVYSPPAGTFTWKKGYPSILTSFWGGQSSLIMQGAIRAFQSNHGLTMTGVMTPALWRDVVQAAAAGKANPNGYTYALASKASPETLTVWHDGHIVMHTLANTGIPAAPTADGTFPVYLRYAFQIMKGTNPDGSHYADPVAWVAYFNGGDAVHYFPRGYYGAPQSLGCVELPYAQAHFVWPYLTYGSLVTVR
ncbi:MAG TPA: L,D-transpeptidase family protein, partial [Streptosporangiaceae bacterium]|nr:L,D-transpeptidase family protein [Streptosporangiaceae bacterium]